MATQIEFKDHTAEVLAKMQGNVKKALAALGTEAVGLIQDQMQTGYEKPIWKTGDLQRDVNYSVENSGPGTVDVGNSLEYAPFVHDGTRRMKGRPYIRDALNEGADRLKQVVEENLKEGF